MQYRRCRKRIAEMNGNRRQPESAVNTVEMNICEKYINTKIDKNIKNIVTPLFQTDGLAASGVCVRLN